MSKTIRFWTTHISVMWRGNREEREKLRSGIIIILKSNAEMALNVHAQFGIETTILYDLKLIFQTAKFLLICNKL